MNDGEAAAAAPQADVTTDAAAAAGPAGGGPEEPVVLSKNAQKKILKLQRIAEKNAFKKAKKKAAKSEIRATRIADSQARLEKLTPDERQALSAARLQVRAARKEEGEEAKRLQTERLAAATQTVVIDLEFNDLMGKKEIKSLSQQLMFSYAANTRAAVPCVLHFTGVTGSLADCLATKVGAEKWEVARSSSSYLDIFKDRKSDLVYLTADAPTELNALDTTKIYIIGGLVDRNKYKSITLEKAAKQGIASARLPIGQHMKLASSAVLTVNHVVDILLGWAELKDWALALERVIPPRKRAAGGGSAGENGNKNDDNHNEDESGEGEGEEEAGNKEPE